MKVDRKRDTRTAILDAAETMMAEHGINGVSLRSILTQAEANSAALHYHFGSREGLIEAILSRRGRKPSQRRREMLDQLESKGQTVDVYEVVGAVVDPMIEMLVEEGESGRRFLRFIARLQSDRAGIHQAEEDRYFPDNRTRLRKMTSDVCSHLTETERLRRLTMMLDTMLQSLANAEVMSEEWTGNEHHDDLVDFSASLKDFLAGALSAPVRRDLQEMNHSELK
jgi:AcrR family transcriptional regulator